MRLLILSAAFALSAGTADAGLIFHRKPKCAGGQCQPATAFPAAAPVAAGPAVTAPACVNGSCTAAPVAVRRGLFGR